MPEEDVKLRFSQEGAEQTARAVNGLAQSADGVVSAFRRIGQAAAPLREQVGQVTTQQVQRVNQLQREAQNTARQMQAVGTASAGAGAQVARVGTVFTGLTSSMAGQISPALAAVASNFSIAAGSMQAFGAVTGSVIAVAGVVEGVLSGWAARVREATEFQTRLNLAIRMFDVGGTRGALQQVIQAQERFAEQTRRVTGEITSAQGAFGSIVSYWQRFFGPTQEEMTERADKSRAAYEKLFMEIEKPTLDLQAHQALLDVTQKQAQSALAQAKTVEQVTAAFERQRDVMGQLAAARTEQIELETAQRVRQERALGAPESVVTAIEEAAQSRIDATRAGIDQEITDLARTAREREAALAREGMNDALTAVKEFGEQRMVLMRASYARELDALQDANQSAASTVRERQRIEEAQTRETLEQRLALLAAEQQQLEDFAEQYSGVAGVQEQADRRLIALQRERVQAEAEAGSQIIQQRRQVVQQMRQLALEEAGLGGDITAMAQQELAARGVTRFSREDLARESERIRQRGAEISERFAGGEQVTAEELSLAQRAAPTFARMGRLGTTAMGATGAQAARLQAGFAGREAPAVAGGGLLGIGAFDPTRESFELYSARLRLAEAREQAGEPTVGIPGAALPQVDETMQQVDVRGTAVIDRMLERVPPVLEGLFERFVDGLLRKIEQEAARA